MTGQPTKKAAELMREIAAADPDGHKRALARGYGVGPVLAAPVGGVAEQEPDQERIRAAINAMAGFSVRLSMLHSEWDFARAVLVAADAVDPRVAQLVEAKRLLRIAHALHFGGDFHGGQSWNLWAARLAALVGSEQQ